MSDSLIDSGRLIIAEVASRITDVKIFVNHIEQLGFELDVKDLSSPYFWRFEFLSRKHTGGDAATVSESDVQMERDNEKKLIKEGKAILKPCLYKKR